MSLKQECIDIMNLIVQPLMEKTDYELEFDSRRDICNLKGEDVTYGGCEYCKYHGNCQYKLQIKVDISFWNYGDCWKNYIFSKKSDDLCNGVCYIRSRKGLMKEMYSLKKELEDYKSWCAEFGEKYSEYMDYAKEFSNKLKQNHFFFDNVNTDILPIIFHTDFAKDKDGKENYTTRGNLTIFGKQNVINCFCCMTDIEETKRSIRHELLHYFLYVVDLKYEDDTAIFHYLCKLYEAHAYKQILEEEQKLYDELSIAIKEYEKYVSEIQIDNKTLSINKSVMMYTIGSKLTKDDGVMEAGRKLLKSLIQIYERRNVA